MSDSKTPNGLPNPNGHDRAIVTRGAAPVPSIAPLP